MKRLVADASAIVDLLTGSLDAPVIRACLLDVSELDVPEHFHVEAISALRGLRARGELSAGRADRALGLLLTLRVVRHPVAPLAHEIWSLRGALTAHDAAYLALARAIDAGLLTADRGLAEAGRREGRLVGPLRK